jgi:hypothetical protein
MGDIRHKITAHLLILLKRTGELIKVLRQLAQFILTARVNASGEIPGRQLVGTID